VPSPYTAARDGQIGKRAVTVQNRGMGTAFGSHCRSRQRQQTIPWHRETDCRIIPHTKKNKTAVGLKYRRLRRDMIEVFEITHDICDSDASLELAYHDPGSITIGNKYKLLNNRFHYDLRKHYFSARIVNT